MDNKKIFALYDEKAEAFQNLIEFDQFGQAERWLTMLVKNEESMVCQYPEDYKLYSIGEFDRKEGKLITNEIPKLLGSALTIKQNLERMENRKLEQVK